MDTQWQIFCIITKKVKKWIKWKPEEIRKGSVIFNDIPKLTEENDGSISERPMSRPIFK
jgi:hypothetical protein